MELLKFLPAMKHSPVKNYGGIPGLTSLVDRHARRTRSGAPHGIDAGTPGADHPHSHRFDFHCIVLSGTVRNRIWKPAANEASGDIFRISELKYAGDIGRYRVQQGGMARYGFRTDTHIEGDDS
jgi:hypothetical protein